MRNAALNGAGVGVWSLEMKAPYLALRMLAAQSDIILNKLQTGSLTDVEYKKLAESANNLSRYNIFFDDANAVNLRSLKAKARRLKKKHDIGLIVIDYLQLMHGESKNNREQEIATISRELKNLAQELEIPIVALSQLSRDGVKNSTSYVWMQSWSDRPISINPSGNNVLIGTTSDNGNKLQVSGTAKFTGQIQSDLNNIRSSSGTQAGNSTGDVFRFLSPTGAINNGCYSAIFHIWVSDNNTGANAYSATFAVQTTSNGQTNATLTTLASQGRGSNPVSSINLISDGGGGAAKISMTTTATPTSGVTYQCSAIGIF